MSSEFNVDEELKKINKTVKRVIIVEFDKRLIDPLRFLELLDKNYHVAFDYSDYGKGEKPEDDPLIINLEREKK